MLPTMAANLEIESKPLSVFSSNLAYKSMMRGWTLFDSVVKVKVIGKCSGCCDLRCPYNMKVKVIGKCSGCCDLRCPYNMKVKVIGKCSGCCDLRCPYNMPRISNHLITLPLSDFNILFAVFAGMDIVSLVWVCILWAGVQISRLYTSFKTTSDENCIMIQLGK